MTPQRQLKRNLRTIGWTIGGMCLTMSLLVLLVLFFARRDQDRLVDRQITHYTDMIALENAIGYGGLIHQFKNYILRPGETAYRDGAIASADSALAALDKLQADTDVAAYDIYFDGLRDTIRSYLGNVAVVDRLHREGLSAREIDSLVRIDDDAALTELSDLQAQIIEAMRVKQSALMDRNAVALIAPVLVIVFLLGGLVLLVRQRARLRREHDHARLGDMESFTQIAAHDLRGPLLQITALADFARDDIADGPEGAPASVLEHLDMISQRVRKLDAMIRAVFRYIQVEGAAQQIDTVDLRVLATDMAALHLPAGATLQLEGDFPTIRAQKVELEIILRNLMSNAVKHHPTNTPRIVLRHRRAGRMHHFELEDDGPGIPPEHADRVFEMFWSATGHQNSETVSGIGLALVRRIVLKWDGELALRNAGDGGAIFSFTMPSF